MIGGLINTASPINRIPLKILAYVFELLPTRSRIYIKGSAKTPFVHARVEDLHPLPKVCRYWRELALAMPTLWNTIFTTSQVEDGVTKAIFRRSIYLPDDPSLKLSVRIDRCGLSDLIRVQRFLLTCGARLQSLEFLRCSGLAEISRLFEVIDASELQHLCVDWQEMQIPDAQPSTARFLPFFIAGGSRLRSLCLKQITFLPANEFPALSLLAIDLDVAGACAPPRWDIRDFLKFLSGCPRLEEIYVLDVYLPNNRFLVSGDALEGSATRVSLPHLRYFAFAYVADYGHPVGPALESLLVNLAIPPRCHLFIDVGDDRGPLYTNRIILDNVLRHVASKVSPSRISISAESRYRTAVQLVFPNGSLRLYFKGGMTINEDTGDFVLAVNTFLRTYPDLFVNIEELRFQCLPGAPVEELYSFLPAVFPNVKAVAIAPGVASSPHTASSTEALQLLAPYFEPMWASETSDMHDPLPFPGLNTLWVSIGDAAGVAQLQTVLSRRASQGRRIRRLVLHARDDSVDVDSSQPAEQIQSADIAALKTLVEEVIVMPSHAGWMASLERGASPPHAVHRDWPTWNL